LQGLHGLYVLYGLVAGTFLFLLLRSLLYLSRLSKKHDCIRLEGIRLFQTEEPGTPFSFLDRLFWNKELALDTEKGQTIFRHELYHIRQRHTLDILVLSVVRSLFWFNPFFHLILRELRVIHEFLADRYVLSGDRSGPITTGNDRYIYAEWLVWLSARGDHRLPLTHSFFNTHLKRRITMIIQSNQARPRYISRVMVLPLSFLLFCAFAAKAPAGTASATKGPVIKEAGRTPVNDLIKFYLHHLRYPSAAIKARQEGAIWFSIKLGDKGQLLDFHKYEAAPDLKDRKVWAITVTSRMDVAGDDGSGAELTPGDKEAIFVQEARKVSEKLAAEKSAVFPAGEYFFSVVFKLEKPDTATRS
jgi:hypothetical protein